MAYKAKRIIPLFASEAEEAAWWYEHREEISQDLVEAVRAGHNGEGTRGRLARLREQATKRLEEEQSVASSSK